MDDNRSSFQFGPFALDGGRRLLFREGQIVQLVPKALELLELLVAERHRTVSKAELLERLWPETIVAENNLTVTMSALRKALGESATQPRYLQTLSRRGYRFVEELGAAGDRKDLPPSSSSPARLRRTLVASAEPSNGLGERGFVGRGPERARLERSLERALGGTGRVVFVTGEPGIGKTALCESFLESLERAPQALSVMRGRCLEQFGRGEAYLPWLEAWGALLVGPSGERAREVLRQVAPSWCREFPALLSAESTLDRGSLTRDRLLREMSDALSALAAERPLIILLEDLHWADAASCDLLRWLCPRSARQPWLIIGTFRQVEAELSNAPLETLRREASLHGECDELRLGPLEASQVAECLAARFRENAFPSELSDALFRRTEGHPLFLTRLLAFLAQRGDVVERSGVWTLARPLDRLELEVPEDVRAMVRRKLDSLDEDARRALAYASVEGNEFSVRLLSELLGEDALALEERLEPLSSQHRLIEALGDETWPDGQLSTRYRFAHALYQNELYAGLSSGRRTQLHRRTAELLLAGSGPERALAERARLASTLAVHFDRGRDAPRAVEYLELAGQNAHRLCAFSEEERLYVRALELAAQLPEPEHSRHRVIALLAIGWARHDAGDSAGAEASFRELLEHTRRAELREQECEALSALCALAFLAGRHQESRAYAEQQRDVAVAHGLRHHELLAIACVTGTAAAAGDFTESLALADATAPAIEALGDRRTRAILLVNQGWSRAFQSRLAEAEAAYAQAVELWRGYSAIMALECLHALGWVRAQRGRLSAALATFEEAKRHSEHHQLAFHLARLPDGCGWIHRELGDAAGARAHHRAGVERAVAGGARFWELCFRIEIASDSIELGDVATAARELDLARGLLDAGGLNVFSCHVRRAQLRHSAALAQLALARGEAEPARQTARRLHELAQLDPSPHHQALAHHLLAQAALLEGQLAEAREQQRQALALLAEFPMPTLAWRVHAVSAELARQSGESDAQRASLENAQSEITAIAAEVHDPPLRARFLSSPAVRAVADALG